MIKFTLISLFTYLALSVTAQEYNLSGVLKDSANNDPLIGATIILSNEKDTTSKKLTTSNLEGLFTFNNLVNGDYLLKIRYIGYQTITVKQQINGRNIDLGIIILNPSQDMLDAVEVEGKVLPVVQKGDTTQFNANAFKTNPDATTEDLVRKMPGVVVENGTVKAQGEDVQQVLVDGKPFFGNDPTLALRSLPAQVVDKIEVFDQMSDQAQFTGFDDGESKKTINIVTKVEMRNGTFGNLYTGYGDNERYKAGGNMNFFNGDRRISVVGLSNNINEQNFSTQDLLGIASSNSGRRRRRRPGGERNGGIGNSSSTGNFNRQSGDVSNFLVGQQGGINEATSMGFNFTDKWGEKIQINGSYFFNYTDNTSNQSLLRETIIDESTSQLYEEASLNDSKNNNHRINVRMEYEIDGNNSIILTPSLNFQGYEALNNTDGENSLVNGMPLSSSTNNYFSDNDGYNFSNNLLYRHRFSKRGRTVSVGLRTALNNQNNYYSLLAENEFFDMGISESDSIDQQSFSETLGNTISGNVIYTEPIGRRGQLMFNFNHSFTDNASDKEVFNLNPELTIYDQLDTLLSNTFDNTYTTSRSGVGYRLRLKKGFFNVRLNYQYALLESNQVFPETSNADFSRNFSNILPNLMLMYRFSQNANLRFFYRTNTNQPSITQLQSVVDNTDPLYLTSGNPDLKQEYSHNLIARYSLTNPNKASNFFALIFLRKTDNYISNATLIATEDTLLNNGVLLQRGSQLAAPVNLSGYWSARTYVTYGRPIAALKSNLNFATGFTYTKTPGLVNNQATVANTYNISQGVVLSSNIGEKVDFTASYTANINLAKNRLQPELEGDYFYHLMNVRSNFIFWKGLVFNTDITQYLYRGLGEDFDQNFTLVNLGIGKKFMKDDCAELRLTVFDLLKQNNSITRDISESYVEDTNTEVLQRYFMLTFNYRIRQFKTGK